MRLSEYGLKPATIAHLHNAGINTAYDLLDRTCRELIWHSEIPATDLYDILRALRKHGQALQPTTKRTAPPLSERNLEIFRLRVVEGRTLRDSGQQVGIGSERVRQILALYFGLHGEPPAVKARPRGRRSRFVDCVQAGRAIERLRVERELTVEQVAAKTDISTEQINRVEDGESDPTWTTLYRIAVALDTTAALLCYAIEVEPRR